jgi:hypothetical protein
MKTNVIMVRPTGDIEIRQDTKDSFFNANDLMSAYSKDVKSWKTIDGYLRNDATKEYMETLLTQEDLIPANLRELENPLIRTKRGKYGGTWMHPYLFIDFAMWLSPRFKAMVVKWVYDQLIDLRINAGDGFKRVNDALFEVKPNRPPFEYANEAKMINKLVFGISDKGQRNGATEDQLRLLDLLQKADVKLIEDGLDYYDRYIKLMELKKYL